MAKTVRYYIDVDAQGAVKGGRVAEDALKQVDQQSERTGVGTIALGNIFADVAGQMLSRLADLPGKIFEMGTTAEETGSKYNTVFGPAVDEVNVFLDEFATKAGLSNSAAQELTSRAGAIGQGFGYTQQESAELATSIAELAGDLTSFNNVPIEQSSNAIISALSGEREALKTLGIVVNEADVQKQALVETGKENAAQLTQQERAAATMSLIYERAGVAVGDLERTQDSAANTARRVEAQLANIGEELSAEFLPIMAEGLAFLEQILDSEQFDQFMEGTKKAIQNIVLAIDFLQQNTQAGLDATWAVWEWLKDNITTLFINLVTVAKNYITSLPEIFWNNIQALFEIFRAFEEYSQQTISNVIAGFIELGKAIVAALTDPLNAKEKVEQAFANMLDIGKNQVSNFADLGKDIGNAVADNFEENAELLADGLIEYDNSAFTGVEFVSWSEAAKQRLEEGLKVDAPVPGLPDVEGPGARPALEILPPELPEMNLDELWAGIEVPDLNMNWEEALRIPDGTIDTLNQNLASIDLMPDSTIANLQEKLSVVQDLHVNAQSDAERERLAIVEENIQLQLDAREMGISEEQILMEEHLVVVAEQVQVVGELFGQGLSVLTQFQQQQADHEIRIINKRKDARLKTIDEELANENISETRRRQLIQQREQVERDTDQKIEAIKKESFEKEQRAKVFMGLADTASAVVEALPNIPLSIAVGVLGAAQVGVIASQPNPYLEGGLVLERMPTGFTLPGQKLISINENGLPEYIVNAKSTKESMRLLNFINNEPEKASVVSDTLFNKSLSLSPPMSPISPLALVVQKQLQGYLTGGPILERLPEGKTSPGMKMISINEDGRPEYVINASSTERFEPLLDLINYHPDEAAEIMANMGFIPEPFLTGGLTTSAMEAAAPSVSPLNQVVLDVPEFEGAIASQVSEAVREAVIEGFAGLSKRFDYDGRRLVEYIESEQSRSTRNTFRSVNG